MRHFMDHLAGPVSDWWTDLGHPVLTPEVRAAIIRGVEEEAAGRSIDELEQERDRAVIALLAMRRS